MMGDDPNGGSYEVEEEDDFHFQTRLINVLAKNGKYLVVVLYKALL